MQTWDLWGDHSLPTLAALNVDMTVADVYDRPDVKDFNNYSVQLSIAGFVAYAIEADICNCEDPCNVSLVSPVLMLDDIILARSRMIAPIRSNEDGSLDGP